MTPARYPMLAAALLLGAASRGGAQVNAGTAPGRATPTAPTACLPVALRPLGRTTPLSAPLIDSLQASMTRHFHPERTLPDARYIMAVTRDGLTMRPVGPLAGNAMKVRVTNAVAQSNYIAIQYAARVPLVEPIRFTVQFRPSCVIPPDTTTAPRPFFEFQVEKTALPTPGSPAPVYPAAARTAGIGGEVLAQFVISEDGRPEMSTFKVLKSPDQRLTDAVRDAIAKTRYFPAEIGGRSVRQVVQQPFVFTPDR